MDYICCAWLYFVFCNSLSILLSQSEGEDAVKVPLVGGAVGEGCDEVDLSCNTLTWLGKDYNNFIRKDWIQLDQPFQGTQTYGVVLACLQEYVHCRRSSVYTDFTLTYPL